jgi:hypothetical protein
MSWLRRALGVTIPACKSHYPLFSAPGAALTINAVTTPSNIAPKAFIDIRCSLCTLSDLEYQNISKRFMKI